MSFNKTLTKTILIRNNSALPDKAQESSWKRLKKDESKCSKVLDVMGRKDSQEVHALLTKHRSLIRKKQNLQRS